MATILILMCGGGFAAACLVIGICIISGRAGRLADRIGENVRKQEDK